MKAFDQKCHVSMQRASQSSILDDCPFVMIQAIGISLCQSSNANEEKNKNFGSHVSCIAFIEIASLWAILILYFFQ